jgi:flagellar hook-length control protein FliK
VLEDIDSKAEPDEPLDEESDSDESAVAPQAAATEPAPPTPDPADEVAIEVVALDEEATAVHGAAVAEPKDATALKGDVTVPAKVEDHGPAGPISTELDLSATTAPETVEQPAASTTSSAEKPKRSKIRPQDNLDGSEEPSAGAAEMPAEKPAIRPATPGAQSPENTTILGPPEAAPLEFAKSEDTDRSSTRNEAVQASEVKALPAATEAVASAPAVDSGASSTAQATPHPAAGAAAAAPKPPAVLLKAKADSTDAARAAGEIDPARFLSRVAKAFESAHQRGSEVRLRLHPAELGALSIEVKIHDNVLTASVQAETPEAKAAIIDNLPALRERLADQGIRIDRFDVDLMDHSDRRQQSLDEQTRQQEAHQSASLRGSTRRVANTEATPAAVPRNRAAGQGGLNVVI